MKLRLLRTKPCSFRVSVRNHSATPFFVQVCCLHCWRATATWQVSNGNYGEQRNASEGKFSFWKKNLDQRCAIRGPRAESGKSFCGPRKCPDFKRGIANLSWVASELSVPHSLTHAAVEQSGHVHLARQCCVVAQPWFRQLVYKEDWPAS